MSAKRLNKRQAREQQELEQLALERAPAEATEQDSEQDSDEDESGSTSFGAAPAQGSIFAALGGGEGGSDDDEQDESDEEDVAKSSTQTPTSAAKKKKNRKSKKKKKAPSADATAEASANPPVSTQLPGKKAQHQTQVDKVDKDLSQMSMDDFDSLLASQPHLTAGGGAAKAASSSSVASTSASSPANALRSSLSLQQNHLDPSVELKRQFGSAAIKAFEASNGGTSGAGGNASGARARMMARNPNLKLRSVLVQPREDWPPIARTFTGMSGELHDADATSSGRTEDNPTSGKVATWEHSRAYRAAQYEFQQAVASHDPNNIYALFRSYPWHVHLLSSLSDIAKHQGDLGQASDWNARVLFAYERTASPVFTASLTSPSGPIPVDFAQVENRGLYLAAHRMIAFLGRRGTWRTALEWAKFMLGLDIRDPHACLLWVDFLAIKSKQHKWLVEEFLPKARKLRDLSWAGGLEFAEALGVRMTERQSGDKSGEKSTAVLKDAIAHHGYLLPALYTKLSLTLPAGMADHVSVTGDALSMEDRALQEIIAEIYAARNESLWRENDTKDWLVAAVKDVWSSSAGQALKTSSLNMTEQDRFSLYRHVLVADMPDALRQSLTSLIPKKITSEATNLDAFDPLPPTIYDQNATRIDDEYFAVLYRQQAQRGTAGQSQAQQAQGMMQRLQQVWEEWMRGGGGGDGGGDNAAAAAAPAPGSEEEREFRDQLAMVFEQAHREAAGAEEGEDEGGEEGPPGAWGT